MDRRSNLYFPLRARGTEVRAVVGEIADVPEDAEVTASSDGVLLVQIGEAHVYTSRTRLTAEQLEQLRFRTASRLLFGFHSGQKGSA